VDLDYYAIPYALDGATTNTHEYWATFPPGAKIAPGGTFVICHSSPNPDLQAAIGSACDFKRSWLPDGDNGWALVRCKERANGDAVRCWTGSTFSSIYEWYWSAVVNGNNEIVTEDIDYIVLDRFGDYGADPGLGWAV
jgi:hypothetical protein